MFSILHRNGNMSDMIKSSNTSIKKFYHLKKLT